MRIRGPLAVIATVCSKWAERLPSGRHHGPLVAQRPGGGIPHRDHRLDRQGHALEQAWTAPRGPVVGHLRLLVEAGADAVPHQLAHHPESRALRHLLHRVADIPDVVPHPGLGDRRGERLAGHRHQPLGLRRDLAHGDGGGRVGVEALQLHPHVHAHDAPLGKHPPDRGDAVDDLLVDRGAEGLGEAVEALERRHGALVTPDEGLRGGVEVLGRHAGPYDLPHQRQRAGDDPAGPGHDLDLPG